MIAEIINDKEKYEELTTNDTEENGNIILNYMNVLKIIFTPNKQQIYR